MPNTSKQIENGFLLRWSLFNMLGWFLSCFYWLAGLLFIIEYRIFGDYISSVSVGAFFGFPFGLCLGTIQWLSLKKLNLHTSKWILATSLGWSIFFTALDYVLSQDNLPLLLSILCLVVTLLIGGAIIGGLQFVVLRNTIFKPRKWILANATGLLALGFLTLVIFVLAYMAKSVFLNFFYSHGLYDLADARDYLLFGFLVITVPVLILQRDFVLQRDFGYYNETLRLRWFE